MSNSDLIFIIGRQRSGTTVFRDLLARHGAIDCDEIFHGALNHKCRFYGYVAKCVAKDPQLVHPEHHPFLFRKYITDLRAEAQGSPLVMDVKYFGLNLIPQREDVDGRSPFVINFMRETQSNVVQIIRRNKLRVHVSEQIAKVTGRWSVGRPEHMVTDKPKVKIDVETAKNFIHNLIVRDKRVSKMLENMPCGHRIFYEDMFDASGLFSSDVQAVAAQVLGCDGDYSKAGNMKMNPEPLSELVENFAELECALNKTPHDWMLFEGT